MRYILWKKHKTLIRQFIFFVMGIYVGFFLCFYFHGNQLDELMDRNEQLSIALKKTNDKLKTYEQKQKQQQNNLLIRSIEFHFTEEVDTFIETELLKALMDETDFLIGKKVEDIRKSPEFIYHLLNEKTFQAKEKEYMLRVKIIAIYSNTEIWVSVQEKKK